MAQVGSIGARRSLIGNESDEYKKEAQKSVQKTREAFASLVASKRAHVVGMPKKAYEKLLLDTEARYYIASRALEEKLIDEVGDLEDAIAAMRQEIGDPNCPLYYHEKVSSLLDPDPIKVLVYIDPESGEEKLLFFPDVVFEW